MSGKTIASIQGCLQGSEDILFSFQDGSTCRLYSQPGCWDALRVEEVHGDPADFLGQVLLSAEASEVPSDCDRVTNTFYKLACAKGYLTIRWYGEDSDYYSATANIAWTE